MATKTQKTETETDETYVPRIAAPEGSAERVRAGDSEAELEELFGPLDEWAGEATANGHYAEEPGLSGFAASNDGEKSEPHAGEDLARPSKATVEPLSHAFCAPKQLAEAIDADQAIPLPTDVCADCGFERRDHADTHPASEGTLVTGYMTDPDGEVVAVDTVVARPEAQPTLPGVKPDDYAQPMWSGVDGLSVNAVELRFGGRFVLGSGSGDRALADAVRLRKRLVVKCYAKVSDKGFKVKESKAGAFDGLIASAKLAIYGVDPAVTETDDGRAAAEIEALQQAALRLVRMAAGPQRDRAIDAFLKEMAADIDEVINAECQAEADAFFAGARTDEPSALATSLAEALGS